MIRSTSLLLGLPLVLSNLHAQSTHIISPTMTIQSGIDKAMSGDTVLVLPGTYKEDIDFKGKDITVRAQTSGFVGATIQGTGTGPVVRIMNGETRRAVLQGFVITGGYAAGNKVNPQEFGAGIRVKGASPTIRRCHIHRNISDGAGGGIGAWTATVPTSGPQTSPLIEDCLIEHNEAKISYGGGGAIGIVDGRTTAPGGQIVVRRCTLRYNTGQARGGAIQTSYGNDIEIDSCLIYGNRVLTTSTSLNGGGGIYIALGAEALVTNTSLSNNTATQGSGLMVFNTTKVRLVNCSITGGNSEALFANNNTGAFGSVTGITAENCAIFNNAKGEFGTSGTNPSRPTINVSNSCLTPGTTAATGVTLGSGNIFGDPLFANPLHGNLHLLAGSPCIEKGNNGAANIPSEDMDGDPRAIGTVDIGADEYNPNGAVLYHDRGRVSVANPGSITIKLQTSQNYSGGIAALIPSVSGIAPGLDFGGLHLPLNLDLVSNLYVIYRLDTQGAFSQTIPMTGLTSSSVGLEVHFAAAVDGGSGIAAFSNPIGVELIQ